MFFISTRDLRDESADRREILHAGQCVEINRKPKNIPDIIDRNLKKD